MWKVYPNNPYTLLFRRISRTYIEVEVVVIKEWCVTPSTSGSSPRRQENDVHPRSFKEYLGTRVFPFWSFPLLPSTLLLFFYSSTTSLYSVLLPPTTDSYGRRRPRGSRRGLITRVPVLPLSIDGKNKRRNLNFEPNRYKFYSR